MARKKSQRKLGGHLASASRFTRKYICPCSLTWRVAWNSCRRKSACKRLAQWQDTSKQCLSVIPSSRPLPCKNWRGWRGDFEAILLAMPKKNKLGNIRNSLQDSQQRISISAMGATLPVSYRTCHDHNSFRRKSCLQTFCSSTLPNDVSECSKRPAFLDSRNQACRALANLAILLTMWEKQQGQRIRVPSMHRDHRCSPKPLHTIVGICKKN